jgi:anti-sigma regulatory factor (Ser/Thr protein kinase)/class 3 adenylate cyclase
MLCAAQRLGTGTTYGDGNAVVGALRLQIGRELAEREVTIGYTSASPGAELVFAEEVLGRGGELHLVLPCPVEAFVEQYVAPAGDSWVSRFRAVAEAATGVEISCEERLLGDETQLRFNNQMLQGTARIHAERIGAIAHLLLVWSPEAPAGPGSPADFMDQWPELEQLSLIDLDELRESLGAGGRAGDISGGAGVVDFGTSPLVVRTIFFADMATYSSVSDEQVPLLWDFLADVQQEVETQAKPPILINTWGDAVHAAAETALDLAGYATTLVERIAATDVESFGLKSRPRFRIALHAGPVYVGLHPLTGRSMIYGHHVNRAARIEAVAAPGEIHASQHFVALLRVEMDALQHEARLLGETYRPPYHVEYVGLLDLPKNFGREAIYRILRTGGEPDGRQIPGMSRLQPPELHLTVENDLAEIGRIAPLIERFCAEHDLGEDVAHAINLSLDELLSNTISYGYDDEEPHQIDIRMTAAPNGNVTVTLSDDARAFDPTAAGDPDIDAELDDRPIGGLGIHFVRAVMDEVRYRRAGDQNELTLIKRTGTTTGE